MDWGFLVGVVVLVGSSRPFCFLVITLTNILLGRLERCEQHLSGDQRHVPIGILDRRLYSTQDSINISTTKVKIKDDGF